MWKGGTLEEKTYYQYCLFVLQTVIYVRAFIINYFNSFSIDSRWASASIAATVAKPTWLHTLM